MSRMDQFGALYEEWQSKGLDRRRFLRMVAVGTSASAIAAILAACGGGGSSSSAPSVSVTGQPTMTGSQATAAASPIAPLGSESGTPAAGSGVVALATSAPFVNKKLVVALTDEPDSLDPKDSYTGPSLAIDRCIFEGLVNLNQHMRVMNVLAESWEPSADAKEFTFKLRQGVKFHDGTPFNAAAVKSGFDRALDPNSKLKRHGYYAPVIDHLEVINDSTVKIVAKQPFAALINTIAHPSGGFVSPAAVKKYGADIGTHPVGTGPFRLAEWVHGDHVTLNAFNGYWNKKSAAAVPSLTLRGITDPSSLAIAVQSGNAQFAGPIAGPQAMQLKSVKGITVTGTPSGLEEFVSLNTSKSPFDKKEVRQALNYGVDKEAVLKTADLGFGTIVDSPIAPNGIWGYHPVMTYKYDPDKAKQLLAQSGFPNGFKAKLWTNAGSKDRAVAIQAQLQKIGVDVDVVQMESAALAAEEAKPVNESKIEMLMSGWAPSTGDSDWALRPLYTKGLWPPAGPNYSFYTNPVVEQAIQDGLRYVDRSKRMEAYVQAQKTITEDAPHIFLYAPTFFGAARDEVGGVELANDSMVYLRTIYAKS